jgi:UDP-sulfoquinovose synthase
MKVLILGGDGYLGWPTAMELSCHGHAVTVADNYLRRRLCREQDAEPLFPVPNLHERVRIWQKQGGGPIEVRIGDLCDGTFVDALCQQVQPDAVVHYAEQPSAPFSMIDQAAAALTVHNNLTTTLNLIFSVHRHCPQAHIVKLGTMGEYGTPNIDIEEGWLEVQHKGRSQKFLYPRQASSLYHTTKIMDTDMLWFYVRMWDLRVTDLMQGPVYGLFTHETGNNEALWPFFNYDEIFGTVLNRFVVQAAVGYPLTVYGKGGQVRGYLNIMDTLACVRLCIENAAQAGELRIFNQFTETFSVNELARRVQDTGKALGLDVSVNHLENPRKEAEDHYYKPAHSGLIELGPSPHLLSEGVLAAMLEAVLRHREKINIGSIRRDIKWR